MKKMARVIVKFIPSFLAKELMGDKSIPKEIFVPENSSMIDLIEELDKISEGKFRKNIFKKGRIREDIIVLLNGKGISRENLENIRIKYGDEIIFLPMIDGG